MLRDCTNDVLHSEIYMRRYAMEKVFTEEEMCLSQPFHPGDYDGFWHIFHDLFSCLIPAGWLAYSILSTLLTRMNKQCAFWDPICH